MTPQKVFYVCNKDAIMYARVSDYYNFKLGLAME
jgi:hypothetical protein